MGTKSLAIQGVAFNWLGRGCALLITFVVTPILIHGLGDVSYGIWAIVMSLTHYYALADMGLRGAAVKYVAEHHARGDQTAVNRVLVTSLAAYGLLAGVVLLFAVGAAIAFPLVFDIRSQSITTIRWVVLISGTNVALRIFCQPFNGALAALKRFDLINMIAVGAQVLQAVLVVTALHLGGGLLGMACVTLFVGLVRQLAHYRLAMHALGTVSLTRTFFSRSDLKTLFGFGSLSVLTGVARRLTQYGGSLLVGFFLGPAIVTYYVIAEMLVLRAAGMNKGVTSVVMPVASQLDAQNRTADLKEVLFVVSRNLLAMAITFAAIFIALGYSLIELWIAPEYAPQAYPVLCLLALAMVARMPSNCARSILKGMAQLHFLVVVAVIDIVLTLGLGAILITKYGLVGMAWATLISQILTAGIMLPQYVCKRLGLSLKQYLVKGIVPGVIAAVPALVTAALFGSLVTRDTLIDVIAQACCIAASAAVGVYFFCFSREERRSVVHSLLPKRLAGMRRSTASTARPQDISASASEPWDGDNLNEPCTPNVVFRQFVHQLDEEGVRYALLRNISVDDTESRELDILVDPKYRGKLLDLAFAHGFRSEVTSSVRPLKRALVRYVGGGLLKLDVHSAMVSRGMVTMDHKVVLRRRVWRDGAFVLSPDDLRAHLVCHSILDKRCIPAKYVGVLRDLLAHDYDQEYIESHLARFGADELFRHVVTHFDELVGDAALCEELRDRTLRRLVARRPGNLLRALWCRLAKRLRRLRGRRGVVVALVGPDGVGKTTLLARLETRLAAMHRKTTTVYMGPWGQSILPVSAILRAVGRPGEESRKLPIGLVPRVRWALYLVVLACEFTARYLLRVLPARRTSDVVLCDRYLYDVATGYKNRCTGQLLWARKLLCRLYPRPNATVLLCTSPEVISARKQDLSEEAAPEVIEAYRDAAREFDMLVVDAGADAHEVEERVLESLWPVLFCRGTARNMATRMTPVGDALVGSISHTSS